MKVKSIPLLKSSRDLHFWIKELILRIDNNKRVDFKEVKAALFGKIEPDFDPSESRSKFFEPPCTVTLPGIIEYGSENDWKEICHFVLSFAQKQLLAHPDKKQFSSAEIANGVGIEISKVKVALTFIASLGYFWSGWAGSNYDIMDVGISEASFHQIYKYQNMDKTIAEYLSRFDEPTKKNKRPSKKSAINETIQQWKNISSEYGITKQTVAKKIGFVKSEFTRSILLRDINNAYHLASLHPKSAVILTGSVVEELLRQYLIYKEISFRGNTFDSYLKACEDNKLIKSAIRHLADSVRNFRNLVHLENEISSKHSISIPTAKGAVASIFTLINDFER